MTPPVWLYVLVDVLAVHRLTRLVTKDILTQRPRDAVIRWAYLRAGHDPEVLGYAAPQAVVEADMVEDPRGTPRAAVLVACRWCASVWCAAAIAAATWAIPDVWWWPALALAASSASTLLAAIEADG